MPGSIILIAHNLRSCHNVGSLLRTADGLGVSEVLLTGYTPYPLRSRPGSENAVTDARLPHIAARIDRQIQKTALGAEATVPWRHKDDIQDVLEDLHHQGYSIAVIEQSPRSQPLPSYVPSAKLALLVGREVEGVEPEILTRADTILEIPMYGHKESFNVVQAAAMALYHCRFYGTDA